jgi:GT2 family glycosyltransferase
MSALQGTILNTIQLGVTPIIIVSMTEQDGDYLSLLFSNHLATPYGINERPFTAYDNYFSTSSFRNIIQKNNLENDKDLSLKLKLIIEEGFDTKRLLGISIPISILHLLNIPRDFSSTQFVFIYNEEIKSDPFLEKNIQLITTIEKQYSTNMVVINSHLFYVQPQKLLERFAKLFKINIVRPEQILAPSMLTDDELLSTKMNDIPVEISQIFSEQNLLQPTFQADQFTFIFYASSFDRKEDLLNKIKLLICLFSKTIQFHIILKTTDDLELYSQFIDSSNYSKSYYQFKVIELNLIDSLNDIIVHSSSSFIYYDNLNVDYNLSYFFENIQQQNTTLTYPDINLNVDSKVISLSDLFSNSLPTDAFIIHRNSWNTVGQFDSSLNNTYFIWDYFISAVHQTNQKPIAIKAFAKQHDEDIDVLLKDDNKNGYQQVIQKHQSLIESSLADIIKLISSEQQLSLQSKKELQEKISSLQLVLIHSKDELKSFQHLTAQLQQRIGYLENNWYQKLKTKINRIKKIFFKKKSPGSGTLKRILQFIRFSLSKAGLGILRKIIKNIFKKLFLITENRPVKIVYLDEVSQEGIFTYHDWIKKKLDKDTIEEYYSEKLNGLKLNPKISIIMPVYNAPLKYLKEAIESVIQQNYTNWELCIADDNSSESKVKKIIHSYSVKDSRINVNYRTTNGHISAASNSALELVTGDYILLMDHDDLLAENCIAEVVLAINQHPMVDIIYSDEDKIDEQGRHQVAHFKPDWAPDHLLSRNYMGHVVVLKKTLMDKIQGFRLGFEGSQDYDLLLRATEQTQEIIHISKVLYHWRIHTLSAAQSEEVKPYAYIAAKKALGEALLRRGLHGDVKYLSGLRGYKIDYTIQHEDKVSIIIPTKDQTELLKNTIDSILQKTDYKNYEIIILNNNSTTKQLNDFLNEYTEKYPNIITRIEAHFPFNFSKLMNIGAKAANGKYLLLLNNDVEIIHADWLSTMVSYAQQERIGAVGVKLLYPDDTIQHAGVIIGLGGIAGHTFVGAYKEEAGYFNYIQSVNNFSAVTAACLMVRKDAFDCVNGMDEQFEVEYNDVDFCLKLMDAGYNNVYLPQVELYHYESATRGHPHQSKPSYERHLKEMKKFKDKWQKYIDHDPYYNPNLNLGVHDFSMNFSA